MAAATMNVTFARICRLCMENDRMLFPLFPVTKRDFDVAVLVEKMASVSIADQDGCPQTVCFECLKTLKAAHELINVCQRSDEIFKSATQLEQNADCSAGNDDSTVVALTQNYETEVALVPIESPCEYNASVEDMIMVDPLVEEAELHQQANYTQCCGCVESFANYEELQEHSRLYHRQDRAYAGPKSRDQVECSICCKLFSSVLYLDTLHRLNAFKHRLHAIVQPDIIQCCSCTALFTDVDQLRREHADAHWDWKQENNAERPYECEFCFKRYSMKQSLSYHQKFSYSYKKQMTLYRRGCRLLKRRIDAELGVPLTSASAVGERMCCGCTKTFDSREELLRHAEVDHRPYRRHYDDGNGTSSTLPWECDICYKRFSSVLGLELHKSLPYSERQRCGHCSKAFSRNSLQRHLQKVHAVGEPTAPKRPKRTLAGVVRRCQCEHCGTMFNSKSELQSHAQVHVAVKPFRCDQCKREFRWKHSLRVHMRCHAAERPISCAHCTRRFHSHKDRIRHELVTHTSKLLPAWTCDQCGTDFNRRHDLQQHKNTMHEKVVSSAEEDDEAFDIANAFPELADFADDN